MAVSLTEKEFSAHIGTPFQVKLDHTEISLELVEVKGYISQEIEQGGMERFSVFFVGPGDPFLAQRVYSLVHEQMGEFELFLVPLAGGAGRSLVLRPLPATAASAIITKDARTR